MLQKRWRNESARCAMDGAANISPNMDVFLMWCRNSSSNASFQHCAERHVHKTIGRNHGGTKWYMPAAVRTFLQRGKIREKTQNGIAAVGHKEQRFVAPHGCRKVAGAGWGEAGGRRGQKIRCSGIPNTLCKG